MGNVAAQANASRVRDLPARSAGGDSMPSDDGATSAEDGAASAEDGAASAEDGATSAGDGATSAADGATSAADGATSAADGATSAEDAHHADEGGGETSGAPPRRFVVLTHQRAGTAIMTRFMRALQERMGSMSARPCIISRPLFARCLTERDIGGCYTKTLNEKIQSGLFPNSTDLSWNLRAEQACPPLSHTSPYEFVMAQASVHDDRGCLHQQGWLEKCGADEFNCQVEHCGSTLPVDQPHMQIRTVHMIRHPVELVVSSYLFSLQDVPAEAWLAKTPPPEFIPTAWENDTTIDMDEVRHIAVYKLLGKLSIVKGLELTFNAMFTRIANMARVYLQCEEHPQCINLRMEDFEGGAEMHVRKILSHFGLSSASRRDMKQLLLSLDLTKPMAYKSESPNLRINPEGLKHVEKMLHTSAYKLYTPVWDELKKEPAELAEVVEHACKAAFTMRYGDDDDVSALKTTAPGFEGKMFCAGES